MTYLGAFATRCLFNTQLRCQIPRRSFSRSVTCFKASNKKKSLDPENPKDKWNYNENPFDGSVSVDVGKLRLVDANSLEKEHTPPHGVKMLVRDFIEDSLYNPNYGYFPKQATIFSGKETTFD